MKDVIQLEEILSEEDLALVEKVFFDAVNREMAPKKSSRGRAIIRRRVDEFRTITRSSAQFSYFLASLDKVALETESAYLENLAAYLREPALGAQKFPIDFLGAVRRAAADLLLGCPNVLEAFFRDIDSLPSLFQKIDDMFKSEKVQGLINFKPNHVREKCGSVYVAQQPRAWITTEIFENTLHHNLFAQPRNREKPLVVLMDNCSCHRDARVIDLMVQRNCFPLCFPANCTSIYQPQDLCAHANFKRYLTKLHMHLYNATLAAKTKPTFLTKSQRLILNAAWCWNDVSSSTITAGFRKMMENLQRTTANIVQEMAK